MKNTLRLLFIGAALVTFSCSKYRVKTPYKIEIDSVGENIDGIQWSYKSSGVTGTSEAYQGTSTHFEKEFTGTSKCQTSVVANCYDDEIQPHPITIKIYRKGKLVKEASGSGKLTVEFNNL